MKYVYFIVRLFTRCIGDILVVIGTNLVKFSYQLKLLIFLFLIQFACNDTDQQTAIEKEIAYNDSITKSNKKLIEKYWSSPTSYQNRLGALSFKIDSNNPLYELMHLEGSTFDPSKTAKGFGSSIKFKSESSTPVYSTGYEYKIQNDSTYFKGEFGREYILNSGICDLTQSLGFNDSYPLIFDSVDLDEYKINTLPTIEKYYSIIINPTIEGWSGYSAYKIPDSTWVINNYKNTILALLFANQGTFKSEANDYKILLDSIKTYLNTK